MKTIIGTDTGGTFTDCVVIDDKSGIYYDKAPTTPADLTQGVIKSIENVADLMGVSLEDLLGSTEVFGHGTTAALNALISRRGAKVGLITTKGHEDAILIGRVHQKVAGLREAEITRVSKLDKADPLVPRTLIKGVTERVDCIGEVVVPLDEEEARTSIEDLASRGVQAIAVCLLWSFANPSHEQKLKQIIRNNHPSIFVTVSSELVPIMGEYERTATTVINAYIGTIISNYVMKLNEALKKRKLSRPLFMMQSGGGVLPAAEAKEKAVLIVSSGPVGGLVASAVLGQELGYENIITTDMGGTSFDVGLIVGVQPQFARAPTLEKYHVLTPTLDVISIGAGGGSIATVEPQSGILRVGPDSAGADPGPVCYDFGGTEPTVTDADLVLGRLNPDFFLGGRMKVNKDKALAAIKEKIADPFNMDVIQAAHGIISIVDSHMGDLVRKVSLERGYDPRDFVLFAFGGGGPTHVGSFGKELGASIAVISTHASVFSALGIAQSDVIRFYAKSEPVVLPADLGRMVEIFSLLAKAAWEELEDTGFREKEIALAYAMDMRYRQQTHEVRVPLQPEELTTEGFEGVVKRFEAIYERIFGMGTGYREAGIEVNTFRVTGIGKISRPVPTKHKRGPEEPGQALKGRRQVFFKETFSLTNIYDANKLKPGNCITGPAIIEGVSTTVVVHPGQVVRVDESLNMIMQL